MKKSKLKELMKRYSITELEYEDACDFVSDLLEMIANEIKEKDPGATNTIKEYKSASYRAFDLVDYIEEILEGEDEE
jgi:Glu-tRNA(Gln) amidotransferase subunit E-like FAD-binding protein